MLKRIIFIETLLETETVIHDEYSPLDFRLLQLETTEEITQLHTRAAFHEKGGMTKR